jgi:hypothetical protein
VALSVRQSTELFHLVFLRALVAKGEDKALVALKGGCNLRFFFGSVRYSEGWLTDAIDHALGLSFDEYTSQVVAFFEPSHAEVHAARSAWDAMQEDVAERLEALR